MGSRDIDASASHEGDQTAGHADVTRPDGAVHAGLDEDNEGDERDVGDTETGSAVESDAPFAGVAAEEGVQWSWLTLALVGAAVWLGSALVVMQAAVWYGLSLGEGGFPVVLAAQVVALVATVLVVRYLRSLD